MESITAAGYTITQEMALAARGDILDQARRDGMLKPLVKLMQSPEGLSLVNQLAVLLAYKAEHDEHPEILMQHIAQRQAQTATA